MRDRSLSRNGIVLSDLRFAFAERPILHDVSFEARPGEVLAIVGPNGSGKSTALKLMAGLLRPTGGAVLLDGEPIGRLARRELARRLALLTQASAVPGNLMVLDLVGMGRFAHQSFLSRLTSNDEEGIEAALAAMEVSDLRDRRVGELSGGQMQRCRMAMTLAQDAAVLLLDEPTTFLDLKHQYAILETARREAGRGRTVVAVLHDFTHAALFADRVAVLSRGRLYALGAPNDVLTTLTMREVFEVETVPVSGCGITLHLPRRATAVQ